MPESTSISRPQFLLGIAAVLYLGLALFIPSEFFYAGGNFELAKAYAEFFATNHSFALTANIAPGQPVILSVVSLFAPLSAMTFRMIQVVLVVALILEVYLVAKLLFSKKAAFIASVITALWPPVILQVFSQSADLLFSVFILCSLYFFIKAERLHRLDYAAAAGVMAALAALTDPVGLYFPLFYILPYGLSLGYTWLRARAFLATRHLFLIAIFASVFLLSLIPWYYRNIVVFGFDNSPVIQKGWETDFIESKEVRGYVLETFSPRHSSIVTVGLRQFFLVPFGLDALDRNTDLSYKTFLVDMLRGRSADYALSSSEKVVFISKLLATIFHWGLLFFALIGLWVLRRQHLTYIYIGLVFYLLIATFSYGVLQSFNNISPLNGFFFLIFPMTVILGVCGLIWTLDSLLTNAKNKIKN